MTFPTRQLRRHRRFGIDLSAGAGARLRDVSLGGMRVLSKKALRIDERIETSLHTPFGALRLKGLIVRAARSRLDDLSYEYGIEFKPLTAADEEVLRRFLDGLAAKVAAEPESPVEELDLMRLQDRIAELERELELNIVVSGPDRGVVGDESVEPVAETASRKTSKVGIKAPAPDEDTLATKFDVERFSHLVRLGQRLMPLVDDCSDRLAGDECQAVAGAFDGRFSLESVTEAVGDALDADTVLATLFTFYERNLIDFA